MGFLKDLVIKLGLDSSGVDKGVNQANNSLGGLKNMVGKLGAAMGIAFGVSEIISFGKEIIGLASKTEGVKRAFDSLGMPSLMNDLKAATRGAVSEFDLMKSAVSANNFKIPLESLSSYLSFATRRAEETGQSVDYLVDSIIMGIGRKSPMILDNLGISIVDIRNEMEKTGDMAKAVANIINSGMANAGTAADTAATKFGQLSAKWNDFKTALGGGLSEGSKSPVSWLTSALETMTNYIKSETIPTWRKWLGLVNITMLGANIQDANREAEQKKLAEQFGKQKGKEILLPNLPYDTLKTELDRMLKLINDPKQYTGANLAYIEALRIRKSEWDSIYAKEIEDKQALADKAKEEAEAIKKAAEAEAKKRLEIEQTRKAASEAIKQNKGSINDYETLIKLNEERYKIATSDELRNQILKENTALRTQLALIDNLKRASEVEGVKLKEGKVQGVKSIGRKKVDISGLDTSDLTAAVAEFEKETDEIESIAEEFKSTMQGTMMDAFSSFGEALGGMNDLNAGQIVAKLLSPFADLAIKAGTIILTSGIAIDGLKKALLSLNGPVAIAAGAALIAVGVAAKAGLAALAGGGGSSSKQASVSGGSFTTNNSYMQERALTVQVEGRIKGNDIYISNSKESNRRNNGF